MERRITPRQKVEGLYNMLTKTAQVPLISTAPWPQSIKAKAKWPRSYRRQDRQYPDAIWNGIGKQEYVPFCPTAPNDRYTGS